MTSHGSAGFRFSLQASRAADDRQWIELAHRTESSGFDLLVTPDHLGDCVGPLVSLAVAAGATKSLRVGTLVLNNDFWHPLLLAREAASLDLLSGGRFELGIGAGHARPEYEQAGLSFDTADRRVDRLAEAVPLLRQLLDGEEVTFSGQHYRLTGARADPRPVQTHVPLLVGGAGRRVHAAAASCADGVGFTGLGRVEEDGQHAEPSGFPPTHVDAAVGHVREVAGPRLADVELQVLVQAVVITDHPRRIAADLAATRLPGLTTDDILGTPYLCIGNLESIVEKLLRERDRWGFSHYTFRTEDLEAIEPVIGRLAGR